VKPASWQAGKSAKENKECEDVVFGLMGQLFILLFI